MRFGLRAMFVVITACAIAFAVWSRDRKSYDVFRWPGWDEQNAPYTIYEEETAHWVFTTRGGPEVERRLVKVAERWTYWGRPNLEDVSDLPSL